MQAPCAIIDGYLKRQTERGREMKAGVFYSKNDLRIEDIPKPSPKKDEVLIKVMACGICGTDVHIFKGDKGCFPTPAGTVLGHEFSGVVEAVGEDVKAIKPGDRVSVDPNKLCNECYYCKSGIGHFCESMIGIGTSVNGGFAERVNDHSFPVSERLSKWGVHDHLLFSRAVREISNRRDSAPHLDVILSLSSHEPFEVPASQRFDNIYLNSIAYTDSCLGAFIDSLRCCPRWDSTLVVLVADHGYPYSATLQNFQPRRYHIPVIFCGGAVNALGIDHSEYLFGKNALDSLGTPFAFYSFNDGFGLITATDTVVVDAKSDRLLPGRHSHTEQQARAFVQRVMETIDDL